MGWLGGITGGLIGGLLGPVGAVGGAVLGSNAEDSKNEFNAAIDQQIARSPGQPSQISPNALTTNLPGLEQRFNNSPLYANMTARATMQGRSPWAQMAVNRQGLEQTAAVDTANAQANAGAATARATLARRGALRGGATERLARGASQDALLSSQDARRTGLLTRAGIDIADQEAKDRMLGQAGELEAGRTSLWANLAANEANQKNTVMMNNYSEAMRAWAAAQSANALAADQRKSGLFGLGIAGVL